MTVAEIREIAEKYSMDYEKVCIRTQEVPFELGEMTHESKVWADGDETEDTIGGISATDCTSRAVAMHTERNPKTGYYFGEHIAIVCGNDFEHGEDDGEIILKDAVVVEIIK